MKTKDFSRAKYISASQQSIENLYQQKENNFPNALYIWPKGCTRFHTYRLFTPQKEVRKAELAFLCDNLFDLWLNGVSVTTDTKHLQLTDVTKLLKNGENNLHIRGYQSGSDEFYSAAITGGVRIYYTDGTVDEIVTDNQFKMVQLVNFWETEEPEGFETATEGLYNIEVNVTKQHPIALRRSFYFIRPFSLQKMPISAHLYSTALGCYEPYLNGKRISDSFFMPFCQNYQSEYQDFDILSMIHKGDNMLGIITGNGSYNCASWGQLTAKIPEVMAILELKYDDGTTETLYTDELWQCAPSPLIENDIQYGERYDARLEKTNWCTSMADITDFVPVAARENTDQTILLEQNYPYIKKIKEYPLREYRVLPDGSFLYDIGVCIAGRARITFNNLKAGQKVRIRYCERLTADNLPENGAYTTVFYQQDCDKDGRSSQFMRNIDVYYAKGEKTETYECRFAYTGFRYVWVECLENVDQIAELTAFELHNDLVECGEIITNDAALNKIFAATKRSWLNNIFNGPTDCPTREKNYWNGDAEIFSHAACWLTDNSDFLARWTENGRKMHDGPYAWEDETYEIPLTLYTFYGDKEILKRRYPAMLKLIEKRTEFEGMILPQADTHEYCDWLSPTGITPNKQFFCGCWYYHMLTRVADVAEIVGDTEKCAVLREKAKIAREEFNRLHLVDNGTDYDARNQCGIVLPLAFGIAPEQNRRALADTLAEYVRQADYHLTTGFIGTRFIFEVLADYGYEELAYKVITNKTFPSWLDMLSSGATAITESWRGENDPDKSLSMAHFSLGSVIGWFFEYLGGIHINESQPGLAHIVLKPVMIKEIGSFAVRYQSKYGEIYTEWHFENGEPIFTYRVPQGVSVTVEK